MGMSIDKTISELEILKKNTFSYMTANQAFATAIDIICKYQKIEPKIKVLQHFTEDTPLATQRMIKIINEIGEVIEDGNN